jgi:hypothetical protein
MSNDGTAAEKAFLAHWRAVGHVERFPDKKDLTGLNKGKRLADFAKPSDFVVSAPGIPLHYAEVKSTENKSRFPFGDIRPKQSETALKSVARGAPNSYTFYIFSYHLGRWFTMPASQYAKLREAGDKSVLFSELNEWKPSGLT